MARPFLSLLIATLALSALAGPGPAPVSGQERTEIVVAAVLPLSGGDSVLGQTFKKAFDLAARDAARQGGLSIKTLNRRLPVRLVIHDDRSDPATSVALLERAVTAERADALLGCGGPVLCLAQYPVVQRLKIPMVQAGAAGRAIFRQDNLWMFGVLPSYETVAEHTLEFLRSLQGQGRLPSPTRIALVWQDTDDGREYRAGLHRHLRRYPAAFALVLDEGVEGQARDLTTALLKVRSVDAEVLLSAGGGVPVLLPRAYVQHGLYHMLVGHAAPPADLGALRTLGETVEFAIGAMWWTPLLPYRQSRALVERWREAYGEEVEGWAPGAAYEAARVLFRAMELAGTLDRNRLRLALVNLDLRDSLMPGQRIVFGRRTGYQQDAPTALVQHKPGGQVHILYPPDAVTGEAVVPRPRR